MSIRKTLLLSLLLFFSLQYVLADTALVVKRTNGKTETFLLSSEPVLTFNSENCVFSTTNVTVTIPRTNIEEFHFVDNSTDIENQKAGSDVFVRFSGNNAVVISGLKNDRITVLDLSGKVVNADVSNNGEETTVSLNNLSRGIYIIKYDNSSIKVVRK